jgi:PhnB protein
MARQTPAEKLDRMIARMLAGPRPPLTAVELEQHAKRNGRVPIVEFMPGLRDLPRERFKERLRANLERRANMGTSTVAAPEPRATATPYLSIRNASAALEFYKKAFGAVEVMRLMQPDGRVGHAEIRIEGALISMADEFPEVGFRSPESLGGSPVHIKLTVPDVDAFVRRAVEAGATVARPVADEFYGERAGHIVDPFGYTWTISTVKESVSAEEMQRRLDELMRKEEAETQAHPYMREGFHSVTPYLIVPHAAELIEFMKSALAGEERFRVNRPGTETIMHAEVKIGDSMIELADANPQFPPTPATLVVHVDDVDAVFARALKAGATVLQPLADHEYGARSGSVVDASGNRWSISKATEGNTIFRDYRSVTPHFNPVRVPAMIDFLQKAFGAHETYRAQHPDGTIPYAQVRVGDSVIGMGEPHGPYQPRPATLHLYVPDTDAAYERALRAGATSLQPPADQPYGERNAGVTDPFGNRWFLATHLGQPPAGAQG